MSVDFELDEQGIQALKRDGADVFRFYGWSQWCDNDPLLSMDGPNPMGGVVPVPSCNGQCASLPREHGVTEIAAQVYGDDVRLRFDWTWQGSGNLRWGCFCVGQLQDLPSYPMDCLRPHDRTEWSNGKDKPLWPSTGVPVQAWLIDAGPHRVCVSLSEIDLDSRFILWRVPDGRIMGAVELGCQTGEKMGLTVNVRMMAAETTWQDMLGRFAEDHVADFGPLRYTPPTPAPIARWVRYGGHGGKPAPAGNPYFFHDAYRPDLDDPEAEPPPPAQQVSADYATAAAGNGFMGCIAWGFARTPVDENGLGGYPVDSFDLPANVRVWRQQAAAPWEALGMGFGSLQRMSWLQGERQAPVESDDSPYHVMRMVERMKNAGPLAYIDDFPNNTAQCRLASAVREAIGPGQPWAIELSNSATWHASGSYAQCTGLVLPDLTQIQQLVYPGSFVLANSPGGEAPEGGWPAWRAFCGSVGACAGVPDWQAGEAIP